MFGCCMIHKRRTVWTVHFRRYVVILSESQPFPLPTLAEYLHYGPSLSEKEEAPSLALFIICTNQKNKRSLCLLSLLFALIRGEKLMA